MHWCRLQLRRAGIDTKKFANASRVSFIHVRAGGGLTPVNVNVAGPSLSALEFQMGLDPSLSTAADRKTKIVCTLGPSSSSSEQIARLMDSGLDVARINCAHGDKASYAKLVAAVRSASAEVRRRPPSALRSGAPARPEAGIAALAFDIKGPEIRIGRFDASVASNGSGSRIIPLARGERILLSTDPRLADASTKEAGIYCSYALLPRSVRPGSRIFIDDGNVELEVISADASAGTVVCSALTDAPLLERKGVNLPGVHVELPHVTRKDEADIATARELGADYIFASFVQSGSMVREIRSLLGDGIRIIAKIESEGGIANCDDILAESDGIMVARGDLGVQIPPERVFLAQKRLVARANVAGKPVICATQMLESMTASPRPTRAECVDVASAVLDGADAVMLSGETAKGKYPNEAVQMMSRICQTAEAAFAHRHYFGALTAIVDTSYARVPPPVSPPPPATSAAASVAARSASAAAGGTSGAAAAPAANASHTSAPAASAAASSAATSPVAHGLVDAELRVEGGTALDPLEDGLHMTPADIETLASAAVHAAFEVGAALIVVVTVTGRTAMLLSKYRPPCPIVCVTSDEKVARQLQMFRGLHAVVVPQATTLATCKRAALQTAKAHGIAVSGDRAVTVHGPLSGSDQPGLHVTMSHVL